jgi:hypothetical protein
MMVLLYSKEGVIQGDSLSIFGYGIGVLPLIFREVESFSSADYKAVVIAVTGELKSSKTEKLDSTIDSSHPRTSEDWTVILAEQLYEERIQNNGSASCVPCSMAPNSLHKSFGMYCVFTASYARTLGDLSSHCNG